MQFADFSPPASPSVDQQRGALQKGLGRAMQWAMSRRLDDDPLLAACLRDQRYDTQLEETRVEWLWQMVRAVDAVDRFRVPILHALYDLADARSGNQLCELARRYAETGDETFRKRLYEIVEQKPLPTAIGSVRKRSFTSTARKRSFSPRESAGNSWRAENGIGTTKASSIAPPSDAARNAWTVF